MKSITELNEQIAAKQNELSGMDESDPNKDSVQAELAQLQQEKSSVLSSAVDPLSALQAVREESQTSTLGLELAALIASLGCPHPDEVPVPVDGPEEPPCPNCFGVKPFCVCEPCGVCGGWKPNCCCTPVEPEPTIEDFPEPDEED